MQVLSHRGYWKHPNEKNLPIAFKRSFERGFGTETDLRDLQGSLATWIKTFNSNWLAGKIASRNLDAGKQVCIVATVLQDQDQRRCF